MGNCGASQDTFTEVVVSSLNLTELGALGAAGDSGGAGVWFLLPGCSKPWIWFPGPSRGVWAQKEQASRAEGRRGQEGVARGHWTLPLPRSCRSHSFQYQSPSIGKKGDFLVPRVGERGLLPAKWLWVLVKSPGHGCIVPPGSLRGQAMFWLPGWRRAGRQGCLGLRASSGHSSTCQNCSAHGLSSSPGAQGLSPTAAQSVGSSQSQGCSTLRKRCFLGPRTLE